MEDIMYKIKGCFICKITKNIPSSQRVIEKTFEICYNIYDYTNLRRRGLL